MKALIIGGRRHGEWVDLLDGAQAWVDIRSATTHRARKISWWVTDENNRPTDCYKITILVHPEGVGPNEADIVGEIIRIMAMTEFFRTNGHREDVPIEGSPSVGSTSTDQPS